MLREIKKSVPNATQADVDRWRKAGDLQYRVIDGQNRYFQRSVSNLFRFNAEAKRRQQNAKPEKKFNLPAPVAKLVQLSDSLDSPEVYPVKHHVSYVLSVHANHPRLKVGAVVRAWLPFPHEYRQQQDVKLIRSDPPSRASPAQMHRSTRYILNKKSPTRKNRRDLSSISSSSRAHYCRSWIRQK